MMRRIAMFSALLVVLFATTSAFACDKEKKSCPFKDGKAKWMLTELEGEGFLANAVIKAEGDERKEVLEQIKNMVEKCSKGECKCKNAHHCPFHIEGLTYEVTEVETGLEVKVTGGCPGKQGAFRKLMEAKISGKKVEGNSGGCPHAMKPATEGKCDCGKKAGDCECGKKDGKCDCGKKAGDCDCGMKDGKCDCDKKKGDCGCGK